MAETTDTKLDFLIGEMKKFFFALAVLAKEQTKLAIDAAESKVHLKHIREGGCSEGRTLVDRVHSRVDETHKRINRQTKWMTAIGATIFGIGTYLGSFFKGE